MQKNTLIELVKAYSYMSTLLPLPHTLIDSVSGLCTHCYDINGQFHPIENHLNKWHSLMEAKHHQKERHHEGYCPLELHNGEDDKEDGYDDDDEDDDNDEDKDDDDDDANQQTNGRVWPHLFI